MIVWLIERKSQVKEVRVVDIAQALWNIEENE